MSNRLVPNAPLAGRYLSNLAQLPKALGELCGPFGEDVLAASPAPRGWSPVDVLAHLRGCSEVWTFSILAMLAEDEPSLALIDPRRWAKAAGYAGLPFLQSLEAFASARQGLVNVLEDRPLADWSRRCSIAGRAHSVYSQVRRMAEHEMEHLDQIVGLLAGKR